MKKRFILPVLLLSLVATACSKDAPKADGTATVNVQSVFDASLTHHFKFKFDENFVSLSASKFDKDLAMFAYGTSIANTNKKSISKFYTDLGFNKIHLSDSYDYEPTEDSIAYAFAHTKAIGRDFISVSIRGFDYGKEWSSNFDLGLEGEHVGFAMEADAVNTALESYISSNNFEKDYVTILISGYSRAGAVANLLAKRVNDNEEVAYKSDIYTYTFEAPQGATSRGDYPNIFNVISRGDLIPSFAPTQYGLTRYGVDIDIYSETLDQDLLDFNPLMVIPAFTPSSGIYENDAEFVNYLISFATSYTKSGESSPEQMQTRTEFVSNYQSAIRYALSLIFSLKQSTLNALMDYFSTAETSQITDLISADDALYEFLKPYLDSDGYPYVDEELRINCNTLKALVNGPLVSLLFIVGFYGTGTVTRMIDQHYPEVNYVLLNKYQPVD